MSGMGSSNSFSFVCIDFFFTMVIITLYSPHDLCARCLEEEKKNRKETKNQNNWSMMVWVLFLCLLYARVCVSECAFRSLSHSVKFNATRMNNWRMSLFLNVLRCVLLSSKKKLRLNPLCIEELIKAEKKNEKKNGKRRETKKIEATKEKELK